MDKYCETKLISKMDIYFETEGVTNYSSCLKKRMTLLPHMEVKSNHIFLLILLLTFLRQSDNKTHLHIGLGIGQTGLQGPTTWPVLVWPGLICLVDRPRLRLFRKCVQLNRSDLGFQKSLLSLIGRPINNYLLKNIFFILK